MKTLEDLSKYIVYAAIFAVPFIVLVVDSSQLFPFVTGKNFLFRTLVELSFGFWLILSLTKVEYRPKRSTLLLSVGIFVAMMFVSNVFGVEVEKSIWSNFERMDGWITLIHLFAYTLVLSCVLNTKVLWSRFWNTSVAVSVAVGIFAVAQLLKKYFVYTLGYSAEGGLLKFLPIINQGGERLDATFGNATYLATYMLLHIFLTLIFLLKYGLMNRWLRVWYVFAVVLQTISLYYTATRGAILGLVGGILISAILFYIFESNRGTKIRKVSVSVITTIIVLTSVFFLIKDSDFIKNQGPLNRLASISLEDKTTKSRFVMWSIAFDGFRERPVLGYGQENFNYVYNKHYNPELYNQEQWFDRTHNVVFDWLIAGGTVGLLSYLFIWFSLLKLMINSSGISKREKIVYIGMLFAYMFSNMFVFDQITSYMIFFALIAYVHSITANGMLIKKTFNLNKNVVASIVLVVTIITPFAINASGHKQSRLAISAMSIPAANTQIELEDNLARSLRLFKDSLKIESFGTSEVRENLLIVSQKVFSSPAPNDIKNSFFELTQSELKKQTEETSEDVRYLLTYGAFMSRFGFSEEGINYLNKALELAPNRQNVYFELAQAYGISGDRGKMFEFAQKGYLLDRDIKQSWITYVISAKISGHTDQYEDLMEEAINKRQYERVLGVLDLELQNDPENNDIKENISYIKGLMAN